MAFTIEKTSRALRQKPMVRMSFLVNNQLLMRSMGENMGQKHWRSSFFRTIIEWKNHYSIYYSILETFVFYYRISSHHSNNSDTSQKAYAVSSLTTRLSLTNKFLCNKIIIVNIFMASSCILHHTATTKTLKRITMDDLHSA